MHPGHPPASQKKQNKQQKKVPSRCNLEKYTQVTGCVTSEATGKLLAPDLKDSFQFPHDPVYLLQDQPLPLPQFPVFRPFPDQFIRDERNHRQGIVYLIGNPIHQVGGYGSGLSSHRKMN